MTKDEWLNIIDKIDDDFIDELANDQLQRKQVSEEILSEEAEEALKPRLIKIESSSKSGSFFKIAIIAAVVCVVGVFVGVNSRRQIIPGDSTSSEDSASEFRCVSMLEIGGKEVEILNSTEDEIRNFINGCENFSAADTLYINAPEKAKAYKFTSFYVPDYSGKSAYTPKMEIEDFRRVFAYLLPGHELREDCFTYQWTKGVEDVNNLPENPEVEEGLVKDFSKTDGLISFQYDERDKVDSPVIVVPGKDIGSGYLELNKGKLVGYVQANDLLEEPLDARDYFLDRHFPVVGKYAPTSEKSFKLLDKEVKICDAVCFYEDYINNMPIAQHLEKNILTKVHSVTVLQIGEIYGYYFETQMQLSGVNYDVRYTGRIASDYGTDNLHGQSGRGFMLESDCVDIVDGAFLHENLMNVENVEKVLSAEEAINKFSDRLTKAVKFTVNSLEFVYYKSYVPDENGYLNTQTNEAKVVPAWKLTAYNPNDKLTYFCYIDAADGSDFRYFAISEGSQSNSENSSVYSEENIVVAENAVDIKNATESYNADFEQCKNKDYANLDWTNAGKCPVYPVSELYNAEYKSTLATAEISQSEMLDKFKVYCNFYFGEYLDDFAFFRAVTDETTVMLPDTPPVIVNGVSYSSFHRISDYKEKIEDGSIKLNFLIYRNIEKNQYLWWCYGIYPHWINKGGALTALGDSTNKCSSWLPSDLGEPVARYYNNGKNNDVKYKLLDGEVSIGEAIRYFTEEYPKTLPFEDKPSYSVKCVEVYKLTEDTYAYILRAATQYNSVSFEVQPEMTLYGSAPNYFTQNGQALMIKKNDIDVTLDCDPIINIKDVGREITKILPLKDAADIVSKELSQAVKFDVVSTDLIYHGATEENKETKESVTILKPTWWFVLYNSYDESYYNAYVDAVSGEFDYYRYNT